MGQPYWDVEGLTPGGVNPYANGVQTVAGVHPTLAPDPRLGRTVPETTDPNGWSEWDKVYLAGMLLPGCAKVKVKRSRKIDKKQGPGTSGASPTDMGTKPCEIDISLLLWMPQHLAVLEAMMPLLRPTPPSAVAAKAGTGLPTSGSAPVTTSAVGGPNPSPGNFAGDTNGPQSVASSGLEVVHPAINILGIKSLYVVTIEAPFPTGKPQQFECTLRCEEFAPPKVHKVTKITNSIDTDKLSLVPQIKDKVAAPQKPSQNNAGP